MAKDNSLFSKGQSLFEVVTALGVVTVIIVALVALASNAIHNSNFSKDKALATRYSQEATEWLRGERDANWDIFAAKAVTPTWCLPSLSWMSALVGACGEDYISNTLFQREVSFNVVDTKTIEVQVTIFWEDSKGAHQVASATTLTDWR
jgi:Tfp pilus assembly protein PilV